MPPAPPSRPPVPDAPPAPCPDPTTGPGSPPCAAAPCVAPLPVSARRKAARPQGRRRRQSAGCRGASAVCGVPGCVGSLRGAGVCSGSCGGGSPARIGGGRGRRSWRQPWREQPRRRYWRPEAASARRSRALRRPRGWGVHVWGAGWGMGRARVGCGLGVPPGRGIGVSEGSDAGQSAVSAYRRGGSSLLAPFRR